MGACVCVCAHAFPYLFKFHPVVLRHEIEYGVLTLELSVMTVLIEMYCNNQFIVGHSTFSVAELADVWRCMAVASCSPQVMNTKKPNFDINIDILHPFLNRRLHEHFHSCPRNAGCVDHAFYA